MSDWATPADVLALTRVTVTDEDIPPAQALISLFGNVTDDAWDLLSSRNRRLLNWATCYQAAWATQHPDVFTNVDVDSVSQDGVSATPGNENAFLLAPLALRCLRRLSWWNRPLRAQPPRSADEDMQYKTGSRDSVGYDDNAPDWQPL